MSSSNLTRSCLPLLLPLVLALFHGCAPPAETPAQARVQQRRIPVTLASVQDCVFEERITAQGNLLPKHYAMVSPMVDGIVTEMFVEEGDRVEAGKSALLQIDKETLTQAHTIALQDRVVAEHARRDAEAQVVAAQAQCDKARLDYDRFLRLREQQAITPDAMEQMEAGYTVAQAQLERATTAVALRIEQEKQAAAALAIAQKRLSDSLLISPIDGWISSRSVKPGEFASAGRSVMRVADTRVLEVAVFLPGEYYPRIQVGQTQMRVIVSGIDAGMLPVTFKSPEIQEQLRTFEVKALMESPPEGVAPGAIATIEAVLHSHSAPGVPHDVIQIRDGKPTVFVVEEGVARAVTIQPGLSTDGWTELLDGTLAPGVSIVHQGCNLVNDGTPLDVQGEAN